MDDLLREFLTETSESLDTVDNQLVRFEQDPNNAKILDNIFRLVHTIKGTCGFLGLPRLEALAHAGETLMGKFRDGMPVTGQAVTVILASIDRIKEILSGLEATEAEPEGTDRDLIDKLEAMVEQGMAAMAAGAAAPVAEAPPLVPEAPVAVEAAPTSGVLADQTLERPLRPGEVSLDELERAFRETPIEVPAPVAKVEVKAEPASAAEAPAPVAKETKAPKEKAAPKKSIADEGAGEGASIANQSIRVNVDTLEHLMTMVSELVLTRNQLLEISRRNEDTEFKVPLQRLSNVTAELQEGVMKTRMQPIGNAWQKLPRIVRDLSGELGKQIELEMHGADTELDRQVLDLIKDPLTHMVRNSADHGLETPAERAAAGKPEQGTIRLSAYHEGGHIIICIADNGRGLNTERIKDTAVLRLRNKLLPLMHLKKLLRMDDGTSSDPENGFIVVTQVGSQTFGIVVDGVFHTEEIVVKPMSTKLRHIDMFSGNTILGDGAVIMIIDPNGIAKALGASGGASHEMTEENAAAHGVSGEQLTPLLVFRAGTNQPKAVPLGLVTRLEEIATDKIELSNGRYMVQYREQLMPLVQMAGVTVQTSGAQPILVFADDGRSMGLVVDEIIDIVEERLHIEVAGSQDGILGSAVIKGQATEVIDVGHFLPMAFADWFSRKEMRPSATAQSVLLVDDSAFFRNMLAPVLKAAGYKVRTAPNAQEA